MRFDSRFAAVGALAFVAPPGGPPAPSPFGGRPDAFGPPPPRRSWSARLRQGLRAVRERLGIALGALYFLALSLAATVWLAQEIARAFGFSAS